MKINSLTKIISKKLLLAFVAFSFSTAAYSANHYIGSGTYNNVIDSNGSIFMDEDNGHMSFTNSNLSNYEANFYSDGNVYFNFSLINSTLNMTNLDIYNASDAPDFVNINITNSIFSANNTKLEYNGVQFNVSGGILDLGITDINGPMNVFLTDNSTWKVRGDTQANQVIINSGSKIEFVMTSATDKITAAYGNTTGMDSININFSNDFLAEIGTGEFIFDALDTVVGFWVPIYTLSDNNGTYIWDNTYLGGATGYLCKIDNIRLIPEPSTYAAIFGVLALGLAIYRRRK